MKKTGIFVLIFALSLLSIKGVLADEEIKIGVYYPMTGKASFWGQNGWKGLQLAHKERPEVLGKKVKLILKDVKSDVSETEKAVRHLIEQEKVVALIGGLTTAGTFAGADIAEEAKIPMISPRVTHNDLTTNRKYVFRTCFTDSDQGYAAAKFAYEKLKVTTAAIMIDTGEDCRDYGGYPKRLSDEFREEMAIEYESYQGITQMSFCQGQSDFTMELSAIAGAKPDLVFIAGYPADVARIVKQAREMRITIPFMTGDLAEAPELFEIGGEAVEGLYFTSHFPGLTESFIMPHHVIPSLSDAGKIPRDIPNIFYYAKEFIGEDQFLDILQTELGDKLTEPVKSVFLEYARVTTKSAERFVKLFQETYHQAPDSVSALSWDTYNILLNAIELAGRPEPEAIRYKLEPNWYHAITNIPIMTTLGGLKEGWVISKIENGKTVYVATIVWWDRAYGGSESDCDPFETGC